MTLVEFQDQSDGFSSRGIDTRGVSPDEAAQTILLKLESLGFIA